MLAPHKCAIFQTVYIISQLITFVFMIGSIYEMSCILDKAEEKRKLQIQNTEKINKIE